MIRHVKVLLAVSFVVTCLLGLREVRAATAGEVCKTPWAGTCPVGGSCLDPTGLTCTFTGAGAWSVCIISPWYCYNSSTGCGGTLPPVGGMPAGPCICSGPAISPSGC